jgi:hypothetical protein
MATLLSAIETKVRDRLLAPAATDLFWSTADVMRVMNDGILDLHAAICQLNQAHFRTIDLTNVSQAASGTQLTGVPTDVLVVHRIRPRVPSNYPNLQYVKRSYTSEDFENALALGTVAVDSGGAIFYDVQDAGAPVAAPVILVAPSINSSVPLALIYARTIGPFIATDPNPIPGNSDNALETWCVAHLIGGEDNKEPHAGFLQKYSTEKTKILVNLQPRDDSEPRYVDGMWEGEL